MGAKLNSEKNGFDLMLSAYSYININRVHPILDKENGMNATLESWGIHFGYSLKSDVSQYP
jgi:hypothetical protein